MDSKEFKNIFAQFAKTYGFEKAFGGWFIESTECIVALDLQKSNFSNFYYLNIKIFINGVFGEQHEKSKDLIKKLVGNIFIGQPNEYDSIFNLNSSIDDDTRSSKLHYFFIEFLLPFVSKALSRKGIIELADEGKIYILPAVKEELL